MSDGVDDISLMLGEIRAGIAEGERQRAAIFHKLDEVVTHINQHAGATSLLAEQFIQLKADVAAMKPHVEQFKALRNQGIGVIAMVGLMGSLIGVLLTKFGPGLLR